MNAKKLLLATFTFMVSIYLSAHDLRKIVIFESGQNEIEAFTHHFANVPVALEFSPDKINSSNADQYESAEIISISFSEITAETIDKLPNLKLIATRSTGYDNVDHAYAASKNILVANAPNYASQCVAELTFGLILNLSRKIRECNQELIGKLHFNFSSFSGFDLKGKTLGVVGTGNIGKSIIKIAHGFQMNVIAYSRRPDNNYAEQNNIRYVSLEELLKASDIITLHAPLNKETYHLLNEENFQLIKRNALIINTSRGELIDTRALVKALVQGNIAGAGLDVLEQEGQLKDLKSLFEESHENNFELMSLNHLLMKLPQVIVTPHIAYKSIDGSKLLLSIVADNIIGFINGQQKNIVN